jgi:hypothetical protein
MEQTRIPKGKDAKGVAVMKKFEAGMFAGKVESVTGKRGRFLYKVLYEDGDCEDMDDKEFQTVYLLFINKEEPLCEDGEDGDVELHLSGGETEGSNYALSDEEERQKKRKRTRRPKKSKKEKNANHLEDETLKEAKKTRNKRKEKTIQPVIDVEALWLWVQAKRDKQNNGINDACPKNRDPRQCRKNICQASQKEFAC